MFTTKPVPTLTLTHPDPLIEAVKNRSFLKVKGLINHWPAMKWTFDSLAERYETQQVKVLLDLPKRGGVLLGGQEAYEKFMTFGEFVKKIHNNNGSPCYLGYSRASDLLQETSYDFSPLTIPSNHETDTRLWIGSAGTCSGLHSDLKDNVFAQIVGRKQVFLIPFEQSHLVYPFIDNIVNSEVDPENFSVDRFPKFIKADVYSTIVEPGEVLFIPRGGWHYLRSLEPSISINHWFDEPISAPTFLKLLLRLGPSYLWRTALDMIRYGILKQKYVKEFFFSPASTGERLYNLIRHGDFSKENNPVKNKS